MTANSTRIQMIQKDRPSTSNIGFNNDDCMLFKQQCSEINSTIKDLAEKIRYLKKELKITKNNAEELKMKGLNKL